MLKIKVNGKPDIEFNLPENMEAEQAGKFLSEVRKYRQWTPDLGKRMNYRIEIESDEGNIVLYPPIDSMPFNDVVDELMQHHFLKVVREARG